MPVDRFKVDAELFWAQSGAFDLWDIDPLAVKEVCTAFRNPTPVDIPIH